MSIMSWMVTTGLMVAPLAVQSTPGPVRTVDVLDLDRYLGEWFEIARFPNWFQSTCDHRKHKRGLR
jgi:apolipoprotein D and lipocalin family protein